VPICCSFETRPRARVDLLWIVVEREEWHERPWRNYAMVETRRHCHPSLGSPNLLRDDLGRLLPFPSEWLTQQSRYGRCW
jgi:hypothetical protein